MLPYYPEMHDEKDFVKYPVVTKFEEWGILKKVQKEDGLYRVEEL